MNIMFETGNGDIHFDNSVILAVKFNITDDYILLL